MRKATFGLQMMTIAAEARTGKGGGVMLNIIYYIKCLVVSVAKEMQQLPGNSNRVCMLQNVL